MPNLQEKPNTEPTAENLEEQTALRAEKTNEVIKVLEEKNSESGKESKETYPKGHILNSDILNTIASLEAINPETGDYEQERYDEYINSREAAKIGKYQEDIKSQLIEDDTDWTQIILPEDAIYGKGGWNRYIIDDYDGTIRLSRGSTVTTGGENYKKALEKNAVDSGIKVE